MFLNPAFRYKLIAKLRAIARLAENPLWKQLKVVQSDRVYLVSMDRWYLDNSILGINKVIDDLERYLIVSP